MNGYYIPAPGQKSAHRNLEGCLRDIHDRWRESVLADIAQRKDCGFPLDDDTDVATVKAELNEAIRALDKPDTVKAIEALDKARAGIVPPRVDPGEFEARPEYAGITIQIRVVDDDFYRRVVEEVDAAVARFGEDSRGAWDALDACRRELVGRAVFAVRGVLTDDGDGGFGTIDLVADVADESGEAVLSKASLDRLHHGGLLGDLFLVARTFQDLPGNGRRRFGKSPPPPSKTSCVASAPRHGEQSSGASVGPSSLDTSAPSTRPTSAQGGSTSGTPGSDGSGSSTGAPTGERSASKAIAS